VEPRTAGDAERPGKTFHRIWIGGAASFDLLAMPGTTDVCRLDPTGQLPATAGNPYTCLDPGSNTPFPADSQTNSAIAAHGDLVQSGFAIGTPRLFASLDYALTPNLLLGGRAGYTFGTYPASPKPSGSFGPIHFEARVTALFGEDAIRRTFAPMLLVAAGLAEYDAYVQVPVFLNRASGPPAQQAENAWLTAGPMFVAAGGGMRLLFSDDLAGTLALKFEAAFGGTAGTLLGAAPEVGVQLGF
jgi:hypothetical protein